MTGHRLLAVCCLGSCCLLAWVACAHEDPADQAAHYSRLLNENPGDPDLHLQRGELYRLAGQWAAAATELQRAQQCGADPAAVTLCRAALELDRGDPLEALASLLREPAVGCAASLIRGRALAQLGRLPEAAAELALAVAATPHPRPEDYLELSAVIAAADNGAVAQALAVLDAGGRRLGTVPALILAAVDLELRRGQVASALDRLDTAPPGLRGSPAWICRRGTILQDAGRPLEAAAAFTEALAAVAELPAHRRTTPAIRQLERELRGNLRLDGTNPDGATP